MHSVTNQYCNIQKKSEFINIKCFVYIGYIKVSLRQRGICMTWFDVNPYMCNIIHICIIILTFGPHYNESLSQ